MRKSLLLLATLPSIGMAQTHDLVPFLTMATSIPVRMLLALLVVAMGGVLVVTQGEGFFLMGALMLLVIASQILAVNALHELEPETISKEVPVEPGLISIAWDWFVSHLLVLGVVFSVIAAGTFITSRVLGKRSARRMVKVHLQSLLETIDRQEALTLYWQNEATLTDSSESKKTHVADVLKTLRRIRDDLFVMLEQVHTGTPLTDAQTKALNKLREDLNKCIRDQVGLPLDVGTVLTAIKRRKAEDQAAASAVQKLAGGHTALAAPPATMAVESRTSLTDDLLNPLNPLSPISPWSVWKGHGDAPSHHHESSTSSWMPAASNSTTNSASDCRRDDSSWEVSRASSDGGYSYEPSSSCDPGGGSSGDTTYSVSSD